MKEYKQKELLPGDKIKMYGKEYTFSHFSVQWNESLEKHEIIMHCAHRGDPFERSLDHIEFLNNKGVASDNDGSTNWIRP